jgi:excisionase family DNA binding protein
MDDRLLTLKQLAAYLNVNERTLLKLVQEGTLPGVKIGNQWRFRRAMIDAWLDDQMLGITPAQIQARDAGPARMLQLKSCFAKEHVLPDLVGRQKAAVIVELAEHAHRLGLVRDAAWFIGALLQRENVMPTAIGGGVAFLHTLHRQPQQVVRPFLVVGRSREGVDFDALDGRPTYLFFVLGLKYQELHLPWLAKMVQLLSRPGVVEALREAPDTDAIYTRLLEAEAEQPGEVRRRRRVGS